MKVLAALSTKGWIKRRVMALTVLLLLCSMATGLAGEQAMEGWYPTEMVEQAGFLVNETGVVHVNSVPTDYEYAQMVYFSGVPVVVDAIIHKQTQDGQEDWVHLTVPAGEEETVMSGYTKAEYFLQQDAAALLPLFPQATLTADSTTGTAALYRDNGITDQILGHYSDGTGLTVIGFTRTHFQVMVDGKQGFVPKSAIRATGEDTARISAAEPAYYDSLIPGMEAVYARMNQRQQALTDQYGDINEWTIPMRAAWSQELLEAGVLNGSSDVWVHLLPGEGDLTEEDARAKADQALAALGLAPDTFPSVFSYYYVTNGDPDRRIWQFTYRGSPNNVDQVVQLDQSGAVIETRAIDTLGGPNAFDIGALMEGQLVQPLEGEITNTQAADIAWEAFTQAYPEAEPRVTYDMTAALREADGLRAWILVIREKAADSESWMTPRFDVVIRASDGVILFASSGEDYRMSLEQEKRLAKQLELEKEKGPLFTWSLEDKAAFLPEYYTLPKEGQITQARAWEIASEAFAEQKGWTEDMLSTWTAYYFLALPMEDLPLRWDIQVLSDAAVAQGDLNGYYIGIDATTGDVLWVYGPGDTNG